MRKVLSPLVKLFKKSTVVIRKFTSCSPHEQVILFTKRPTLFQDLTQESVKEAIDELQVILKEKGYLLQISGVFDLDTTKAVKEFQRRNDLKIDGIVGPLTWAALYYLKVYRTKNNVSQEFDCAVQRLQELLKQEGFYLGNIDGHFGKKTEKSVKNFQRAYSLKVNGVVGNLTWAVLLGMRKKPKYESLPEGFYRIYPYQFLFLAEQLLIFLCILAGIYFNPLTNSKPDLIIALILAYSLAPFTPDVLELLPIKPSKKKTFLLFKYAPFMLTGILSVSILNTLEKFIHFK